MEFSSGESKDKIELIIYGRPISNINGQEISESQIFDVSSMSYFDEREIYTDAPTPIVGLRFAVFHDRQATQTTDVLTPQLIIYDHLNYWPKSY